jgi:uncharacterized membrane protein
MRLFKLLLLSLILMTGLSACKQTQQEAAEAGKQAAETLKADTIDAAKEAAALTEKTAEEISAAASEAEGEK